MNTMKVILIVLGANAVLWTLVFALLKNRAHAMERSLRESLADTGEMTILGPERSYCNVMKGRVSVKTMGVIALTDRRLIFKGFGLLDQDIRRDQIAELSRNQWWRGNYRGGHEFLVLHLKDGKEIAFQVRDTDRWAREIELSVTTHQ